MKQMLRSLLTRLRDERGITTVLFALLLPVLLGMQALTIDATRAFVERRELQNAADAASLAAARFLPSTDPEVLADATAMAIEYAAMNGFTIGPEDVSFATDVQPYDRVTVRTKHQVDFVFGKMIGLTFTGVGSHGVAQLGILGGRDGVFPLAVEEQANFVYGEPYCLKYGSGNQQDSSCSSQASQGNYLALDIDDEGNDSAEAYRTKIVTGSEKVVYIGEEKNIARGNMQGPAVQGLNERIGNDTSTFDEIVRLEEDGTYTVLDWSNPRLLVIPVVEVLSADRVLIVRYAAFFAERVSGNGSIIGRFIDTVVPGGVWMPWRPGNPKAVRLVE